MRTRLTTRLGFAAVALAFAATTPALAEHGKKSGHHAMSRHGGGGSTASAADHSADQLNAQSLSAIQQGQSFTPSGAGAPEGTTAPSGGSRGSNM
jgi:hypothetical protein